MGVTGWCRRGWSPFRIASKAQPAYWSSMQKETTRMHAETHRVSMIALLCSATLAAAEDTVGQTGDLAFLGGLSAAVEGPLSEPDLCTPDGDGGALRFRWRCRRSSQRWTSALAWISRAGLPCPRPVS